LSPAALFAAQLPSVFRGVVVADSPLGVRVVGVEELSQAFWADLRPEDIIVRVQETEVRSIDELAALSTSLKGRALSVTLLVFRNGVPRELVLHLYSYPVLRAWGLSFVPDHDVRFADPAVGLAYWQRLGRGFAEAGKTAQALDAYLNGLHNVPGDIGAALTVSALLSRLSRTLLAGGQAAEGVARLRQAVLVLQRLFEHPLDDEQLAAVGRLFLLGILFSITESGADGSNTLIQPSPPDRYTRFAATS
jgi:hypothetical protein